MDRRQPAGASRSRHRAVAPSLSAVSGEQIRRWRASVGRSLVSRRRSFPLPLGHVQAAPLLSLFLARRRRAGTRPVIVTGSLIAAGGVYYLSRIPVHGSYLTDLLPGLVVMSIGLGALLVAVTTAANAGVPAEKAGLAAALLNASQQVGGALGLAIFAAIATSHTGHLLAARTAMPAALTSGFQRALLASSLSLVLAAVIATRASNTRNESGQDALVLQPQPEMRVN